MKLPQLLRILPRSLPRILQLCLQLSPLLAVALPADAAPPQVLTFVMQPFPPLTTNGTNQPDGFFPAVLQAVCASIKVECKAEVYPWRRAFAMMSGGTADGMLMMLKTPERTAAFNIGPAVLQSSYVLYAAPGNTLTYTGPADLAGYTVAGYGPSGTSIAAQELGRQAPNSRVEIEVDNQTALRKLRQGRYGNKAVVVINRELGRFLLKQDGDAGLRQIGELKRADYYIGLSRTRLTPELAERFHQAVRQLQRDGTINAIAQRFDVKAAPAQ